MPWAYAARIKSSQWARQILVGELTSGPKGNTIKPLQLKNQWGVDAAYDKNVVEDQFIERISLGLKHTIFSKNNVKQP